MRSFSLSVVVSLACFASVGFLNPSFAADQSDTAVVIPADSQMSKAAASMQRLLLNSLQAGAIVDPVGASRVIGSNSAPVGSDIAPKFGTSSILLSGEAQVTGAKGGFKLTPWDPLPGKGQMVGMWVYVRPEFNVDKVGIELEESDKKTMISLVPANWTGWKWIEVDLQSPIFTPPNDPKAAPRKVNLPLRSVRVGWFAKQPGTTTIGVNGLFAITDLSGGKPRQPLRVDLTGPRVVEPDNAFNTQLSVTNLLDKTAPVTIEYSVQQDSALFDAAPPDPVYGSDIALGAKSWTEGKGVVIEEGSLTDGKKWTFAATEQVTKQWDEAFQYIDLGNTRRVTKMTWDSGDANHLQALDVSTSADGKTYEPVPSLQNVVLFKRWGINTFALEQPFDARFIRFRYHTIDGSKANGFNMPQSISVYDGVENDSQELPSIGRVVTSGKMTAEVPANGVAPLGIASKETLSPGAYLVAAKVQSEGQTYLTWQHVMVKPEPMRISENSRFGMNVANPKFVPDLRNIGIGWVRYENMKWPMVSAERGVYDFVGTNEPHVNEDAILKGYNAGGLNVLPFLFLFQTYAPKPATPPAQYSLTQSDLDGFAEYSFQTVARYGSTKHPAVDLKTADKQSGLGLVKHWEIWNEQNHNNFDKWGGAANYYNFFRVASEAVKKADPTALVSNGGFSGMGLRLVDGLRTHKYPDGKSALDFVDVLSVHMYTGQVAPEIAKVNADTSYLRGKDPRTFEENLVLLRDWRDRYKPGMPIWMTETGYDTDYIYFIDERTQAAWLVRDVMLCLANGIDKVLVYRELGSDAGMWAAAGVMRTDGTPKPSYFSYATLTRQLDGVEGGALRLMTGNDNVRVYAWKRGQETILSAWVVEGAASFPLNIGSATVVDCFGDRQQNVDTSKLTLTPFPIYLTGCSRAVALDTAVASAKQFEQMLAAKRRQDVARKVYAYGFGAGPDDVGGIVVGDFRQSVSVLSDRTYDPTVGYGFTPKPALGDVDMRRNDTQNQRACKVTKGLQFQFNVSPGTYKLQIGAVSSGAQNLIVRGNTVGQMVVGIDRKKERAEVIVKAGSEPLNVELDGNAALRWLTLTEVSATD